MVELRRVNHRCYQILDLRQWKRAHCTNNTRTTAYKRSDSDRNIEESNINGEFCSHFPNKDFEFAKWDVAFVVKIIGGPIVQKKKKNHWKNLCRQTSKNWNWINHIACNNVWGRILSEVLHFAFFSKLKNTFNSIYIWMLHKIKVGFLWNHCR